MSSSHAPSEPGRGFPRFGLAFFDFGISNSLDQTLGTLSPNALSGKPSFGDLVPVICREMDVGERTRTVLTGLPAKP